MSEFKPARPTTVVRYIFLVILGLISGIAAFLSILWTLNDEIEDSFNRWIGVGVCITLFSGVVYYIKRKWQKQRREALVIIIPGVVTFISFWIIFWLVVTNLTIEMNW